MAIRATIVIIGSCFAEGEGDEKNQEGWVGRLRSKLPAYNSITRSGWRVLNLGIAGQTTRDVYNRLGEVVSRAPSVLIVCCGALDVFEYGKNEERHPLAPEYARHKAIELLARGSMAICQKTIFTMGIDPDNIRDIEFRNGKSVRKHSLLAHREIMKKACGMHGAAFFSPSRELDDGRYYSDGFHYNSLGYDVLSQEIYGKLLSLQWLGDVR